MLLALDPSVRSPGVALFDSGGLLAADNIPLKQTGDSDAFRWLHVARAIVLWSRENGATNGVTTVIFERPQIYAASKSKGNPNELIGLAGVGMAVVGLLAGLQGYVGVQSPTPAEWIGQLPKTTRGSAKTSPRAQRILSRLSPAEAKLVPDQHDAIDAVGLGLYALGRLEVRRVFSNGRD